MRVALQSKLRLFDVTNLVVGAIIGADIYVASSLGASHLGPASLLVWVVAGIMSIVIALCFAQCAALLPKVGGPYAYAKEAWGPFTGFIVGWSLWLAEWISLAVFPVAFTRYLMFFLPNLELFQRTIVKILFMALLATTNIVGIRAAGKTNDILTVVKLIPLIFFSGAGLLYVFFHLTLAASNFSPFFPYGLQGFGTVLILVFWAYAGFEISTIPAEEIEDPGRTIPRAIILGIAIVTVFYLVTNVVLFGIRPWSKMSSDIAPLDSGIEAALSFNPLLALIGGAIVGVGALISVAGSDESGMVGTSRLAYALAVDGVFPHIFAKIHPRFKTPYLAIIVQAVTATVASIVGNLDMLISSSVLFMAIAYLATSASIFRLRRKKGKSAPHGGPLIPSLGVAFSFYLITQCTTSQVVIGVILMAFGALMYVVFSPKVALTESRNRLLSRDSLLREAYRQEHRFIAHALSHLKRRYRKISHKKQTWVELNEK